jgi:hypothetical protein
MQIYCDKILMAVQPGYSLNRLSSLSGLLYRPKVSKFYDSRSGNNPKVPPAPWVKKFSAE